MDALLAWLHEPLVALFVVAAFGFLLGKVKVRGVGLGVAAVLFVGLAFSATVRHVELPELIPKMGLALFIYAIGLSSGPGFFALFRRRGLRDGTLAIVVLGGVAAATIGLGHALGLGAATSAGLFCGSLTNTPALASVVERLEGTAEAHAPVVAYSVAYPFGVLGVLLALLFLRRVLRASWQPDRVSRLEPGALGEVLVNATVRVLEGAPLAGRSFEDATHGLRVRFARLVRGDAAPRVPGPQETLQVGDVVTVVGPQAEVTRAATLIGEGIDEQLDLDRRVLDFRRMFVSAPAVVEKSLADLRLIERFGATITRIRRGEIELLPDDDTELELGDRVRVVAPRERMPELAKLFGDSYHALSEIDALTFGLGIVLGLGIGAIPIPLPGGGSFELGVAGGPLLAGLVLGRVGRTGPLVWALPYAASITLRQWGLLLFLAGVGLRSGEAFVATAASAEGLRVLGAGALLTTLASVATILAGHFVLKIPYAVLAGEVAGLHTQPAALVFAHEQAHNDLPRLGYTAIFPIATVAKIVLAQLVLAWW